MMRCSKRTTAALLLVMSASPAWADPKEDAAERAAFQEADDRSWREAFADGGTEDWTRKWFLDGEIGTVKTGPEGMTLTAGPEFRNDAHHMVLWTKQEFEGDLKIDYDYTRLDKETHCVTILYIQATGSGRDPYAKDLSKWSELRKVPSMRTYFNNMNTYHISYAAFPNSGKERKSYIRGRRYMPHKSGLKGTDLEPDHYPEGLFATGVKHHVTVIKNDRKLFNLAGDPGETTNLAAKHPDRVKQMIKDLRSIIQNGRSTPGPKLKNDRDMKVFHPVPKFVWQ